MKLLVLDQFSELGGAQHVLLDLLPAIRERGWEARIGIPGDGELFGRVRLEGFPAERIHCGPYGSGRKSAADVARFMAGTPKLARQITTMADGVDLVYINGPRLLPAAALAGFAAPAVFHAHSHLGDGLLQRIAGAAVRRMRARVIGNCEFTALPWRRYSPEVRVIYNGVRGHVASPSTGDAVVCIGRIAPEKGQLEFLEAAAAILGQAPGTRFVIYGAPLFSGDRYEHEVRGRAKGMPVEFAGWSRDVGAALDGAAILLAPSTAVEATTRVILEAYAAGVPVIAFANGGIPEVVEHGRTGFLARSAPEMAEYAVELLRDPGLRARISAATRDYWARRFTLEQHRREVLAVLEGAATRAGLASRSG